jgi:hypothetical protein
MVSVLRTDCQLQTEFGLCQLLMLQWDIRPLFITCKKLVRCECAYGDVCHVGLFLLYGGNVVTLTRENKKCQSISKNTPVSNPNAGLR